MINLNSSDQSLLVTKAGCDFDVKLNPAKLGSSSGLNLLDSTTAKLAGDGFNSPLQVAVKLSQNPGNMASIQPDGLFIAAQTASDTLLAVVQSNSVTLTANGASNHTLKADVKISADSGNSLSIRADGLYVDVGSGGSTSDAVIRQALSGVSPIVYNSETGAISIPQASSTQGGYLSSSDWSSFNLKEPLVTPGLTSQYRRGDKTWQTLNTTAVVESGSNLYFTQGRFDTAFAGKTTDSLPEGTANFYATPARIRTALSATSPFTFNNSTGVFSMPPASGSVSGYLTNTDWTTFNSKAGTGTNLGAVGFNVFKSKSGDVLGFRKIKAMTGIGIAYSTDDNALEISATVGTPPTANAGSDQNIITPTSTASLVGTANATGTTIVATQWTKLYGPAGTTIANASLLSTTVSGLVEGIYGFRLTVYAASGTVGTDDIIITVSAAPITNNPPVVNAGTDQTITLPTSSVTLTATATDGDGTIASRLWARVSGPNTPTITTPTTLSTTVTGLIAGTYVFSFSATDDDAATSTDNVSVVVNPAPPVLDTVYYGTKADFGNPNSSAVAAGSTLSANADGDVTIDWSTLTASAPIFCWFAVPDRSAALKNTWTDTVNGLNTGGIGTEDELFGPYTTVTISGNPYKVSATQYATQLPNPIKISKV